MNEIDFAKRLALIRTMKNKSARRLSAELEQNSSYINNIENNRTMPSMKMFFEICDCLDLTPEQFFSDTSANPSDIEALVASIKKLSAEDLEHISYIVNAMLNRK